MTDDRDPQDVSIRLSEYEALRREIEMRATLASSLVALELSALGIGLVSAGETLDLYPGLGFLSTMLWLFWLDHTEQIWKLATYISVRLRPSLQSVAPRSLDWERFLRELDAQKAVRSTNYAAFYITLLFAVVPPLLTAVYVVRIVEAGTSAEAVAPVRLVVAVVVIAFWVFGMTQFREFNRSRRHMDERISSSQERLSPAEWCKSGS
ncbi:MAG: hypothetical protein QOI06_935 [Nocardioidaceae bacterium]|jgi:hypothetical protein|nr:hypothetical protein [Nocardioidaceae bacterium]